MSGSTSHPKSFWQFSVGQFLILTTLLGVIVAMITYASREPLKFAAMLRDAKIASERNLDLGQAVSEKNCIRVAECLTQGADPNTRYNDIPVLDLCFRNGDMKSLRMLFEAGAALSDYGKVIESKLKVDEKLEIMRILVNQGTEITELASRKAVQYPEPEIIDFLRLSGADYGVREMATLGRLEELRAVIDANPSILRKRVGPIFACEPGQEPTLLGIALRRGHEEMANWLIDNGADIHALEEFGNTPLFMAAGGNCTKTIARLCNLGCNPNAPDSGFETPLTYWSNRCSMDTIRALIEAGADVNLQNYHKRTPLHCALMRKENVEEVIAMLLDAGANPQLVDSDGKSVRDCAHTEFPELLKILDQAIVNRTPHP